MWIIFTWICQADSNSQQYFIYMETLPPDLWVGTMNSSPAFKVELLAGPIPLASVGWLYWITLNVQPYLLRKYHKFVIIINFLQVNTPIFMF